MGSLSGSGQHTITKNRCIKLLGKKVYNFHMKKSEVIGYNPELSEGLPISHVDVFVDTLQPDAKSLFKALRVSNDYMFAQVVSAKHIKESNGELNKVFHRRLTGFIFESLAHQHLKRQLPQTLMALTPQETFEIYYLLHTSKKRIVDEFGFQLGIENSYVPDSLILEVKKKKRNSRTSYKPALRLVGVAEYMVSDVDIPKRQKKITSIQDWVAEDVAAIVDSNSFTSDMIGNYLRSRYPDIPRVPFSCRRSDFITHYVTPEGVTMPTQKQEKNTFHVPIGRDDFKRFINLFLIDVRKKIAA